MDKIITETKKGIRMGINNTFCPTFFAAAVSAALFNIEIHAFPETISNGQAKEIFQIFITTSCGLIAMYITFIFALFNTKHESSTRIIAIEKIPFFIIGIILSICLIMALFSFIASAILPSNSPVEMEPIIYLKFVLTFALSYLIFTMIASVFKISRAKEAEVAEKTNCLKL